jgi:hypothetical protein
LSALLRLFTAGFGTSGQTAECPLSGQERTSRERAAMSPNETHKMMLDHYQQTKNPLVSYSLKKLGFF